jgi:hypothetical protein
VALQRDLVKVIGFPSTIEFTRKCPKSRKNYLAKTVRGGQTLYMTGHHADKPKSADSESARRPAEGMQLNGPD